MHFTLCNEGKSWGPFYLLLLETLIMNSVRISLSLLSSLSLSPFTPHSALFDTCLPLEQDCIMPQALREANSRVEFLQNIFPVYFSTFTTVTKHQRTIHPFKDLLSKKAKENVSLHISVLNHYSLQVKPD